MLRRAHFSFRICVYACIILVVCTRSHPFWVIRVIRCYLLSFIDNIVGASIAYPTTKLIVAVILVIYQGIQPLLQRGCSLFHSACSKMTSREAISSTVLRESIDARQYRGAHNPRMVPAFWSRIHGTEKGGIAHATLLLRLYCRSLDLFISLSLSLSLPLLYTRQRYWRQLCLANLSLSPQITLKTTSMINITRLA